MIWGDAKPPATEAYGQFLGQSVGLYCRKLDWVLGKVLNDKWESDLQNVIAQAKQENLTVGQAVANFGLMDRRYTTEIAFRVCWEDQRNTGKRYGVRYPNAGSILLHGWDRMVAEQEADRVAEEDRRTPHTVG